MSKFLLLLIWALPIIADAQIVLSEIMFDPAGPEASDEFVEIVNIGHQPVDLSGWMVGDSAATDIINVAGSAAMLLPGQYGVIFDSDYDTLNGSYSAILPDSARILLIEGGTIGSRGLSNSTAEAVVIINAVGDTVDFYRYTTGNLPGFSEERRDLTATSDSSNWGNSLTLLGSPGMVNTLTPRPIDLAVVDLRNIGNGILRNRETQFQFDVRNLGEQSTGGGQWIFFIDRNSDRVPQLAEILADDRLPPLIAGERNDTVITVTVSESGWVSFGLQIAVPGDRFPENDTLFIEQYIDDPAGARLFINEIMFEPKAGEVEWVEIVNSGDFPIALDGFHFADLRDTVVLSGGEKMLAPDEYLLLAGDSSIFHQEILPETAPVLVAPGFPTLNNSFDEITLIGPGGLAYDRVTYTENWYGREVEAGTSLEKINPQFDSRIAQHWAASVHEATPGRQNSVFVATIPQENAITVAPNPFSPDGDGFEDVTVIGYQWVERSAFLEIQVFDLRGRRVRTLLAGQPVAANGQLVWDGKDENGRRMRIGAYILLVKALDINRSPLGVWREAVILYKQ